MPADRTLAEDLAQALVDLYSNAQQQLVTGIARRLKAGIDRPDWAHRKLIAVNELRQAVSALLDRLQGDTSELAEQQLVLAYARGGQAALEELAKVGQMGPRQLAEIRQALPGTEAIQRLVFALVSTLLGTHVRILRWSLDSYREVIATSALPDVLMGTRTRLAAAQVAWERLLERGVTGFVDKSGRRWELASYTEMATRTGVAQAAVQGHLDRLGDAGLDLVIVSNAPQECKLCRPWEGKVLDRNGAGGQRTVEVEHAIEDDRMVKVEVAGSVVEAVARGLMHPNCRHSLSAYLPGVTKPITHTQDPEGDRARQQLRALERKVRKAKQQAAGALSPADKKRHEARVRECQARIREHIANAPTTLHRQSHREQIGQAR